MPFGIADSLGELVEKEIKGGNPAVPGDDEISPGVRWRLTRAARYPLDPPAVAQFLGSGNWLVSKVRMRSPDRARDAIDLVAATVDAAPGIVEHAIFSVDLVDGRAPTPGVVFTEDVVKIARQQGRYAVGHGLSPLLEGARLRPRRDGVLVHPLPGYPSMRSGPATLRTRGGTPHDGSKQGTLRASRRRRQGANPPAPGRRGTQRCGRSQARG